MKKYCIKKAPLVLDTGAFHLTVLTAQRLYLLIILYTVALLISSLLAT